MSGIPVDQLVKPAAVAGRIIHLPMSEGISGMRKTTGKNKEKTEKTV